jgi:ferredoxin-NADP reductase
MAGTAVLGRLIWRLAEVVQIVVETPRVHTVMLEVPGWEGHHAGQHVDVRLTAEDGYQAARSYSIASPPEDPQLSLTIEELDNGEVSPYLVEALRQGDQIELRGPIGGYFRWDVSMGGPLLLVAGGSGIVPLMAMIRHRAAAGSRIPTRLLYSSRSFEDIIYREELERLAAADETLQVIHTLTRSQPAGWAGYRRRVDLPLLEEVAWQAEERPLIYVCGPTPFVETVATDLLTLRHEPTRVKTERFGATGR